ncbi:unnamed protein product [Prorocentrum cordatum]|uniref:Uncharacterized protein n=1 Tax=Prorocentrum cordatum TaxID=2364126 RepID=A0ABN9UA18_9DINO|nr:unnamed protein product [Polarella glacialis]
MISDTWHWTAALAVLVVCLWLARRLLPSGSGDRRLSTDSQANELASAAEEYPDLGIPLHRHVEMALDPPQGLHWSNPRAPYEFENELCWGKYIFFHPPRCKESEGAGVLDFHKYRRREEARVGVSSGAALQAPPCDRLAVFLRHRDGKVRPSERGV